MTLTLTRLQPLLVTIWVAFASEGHAQDVGLCGELENCCDYAVNDQCSDAKYSGNRLSIVVGVDRYDTGVTQIYYKDLQNAVNDAREIGKVLSASGVETRFVFNPSLAKLSQELLMLALHVRKQEDLARVNGYDERPFVKAYFAGHGLRGEDARDYLILPITQAGFTARDDYLLGTDAVAGFFSGLKQFDFTFVFDACRTFVSLPPDAHGAGRGAGKAFGSPNIFSANVSQYMTVLSTSPLTAASDVAPDRGDMGLFARYFTYFLSKPGLQFEDVVALTGWFVKAANPGQEPVTNSSPAPGIKGRRLIDVVSSDTCAMAELTLFDELKKARMCGTYSPSQNRACVDHVASLLLQAAAEDGSDISEFLQQCTLLNESLALLDPDGLILEASEALTPLISSNANIPRPTVSASYVAPEGITLNGRAYAEAPNWKNSPSPDRDSLTALYAFAGQSQTPQAFLNGQGSAFFDPLRARDPTRFGNLSDRFERFAGVPITVPDALDILRAPSQGSDRIFERLPKGGTARLDCVNAQCSREFLGITIYQDRGDVVRGFVDANEMRASAAPPLNSDRHIVRFEEGTFVPDADQIEALAETLRTAPSELTLAIWSPPPQGSTNAFLQTRIRTNRVIEQLEELVPEQTRLRSRVSELALTESEFGPDAFVVEVIYN